MNAPSKTQAFVPMDRIFGRALVLSGVSHEKGCPGLVFDDPSQTGIDRRLIAMPGALSLSMQRLKARYCIGCYNLYERTFNPCPDTNETPTGRLNCPECVARTGYNPAFDRVDRTQLSKQQLDYLEHPHVVYLAHFGGELIKVGISHANRVRTRWTDQGALSATIVASTSDAWSARRLEQEISDFAEIPERYSSRQKRQALEQFGVDHNATEPLERARSVLLRKHGIPIDINPIESLAPLYFTNGPAIGAIEAVKLREPLALSGTFRGLIGAEIILEVKERIVAIGLQDFIGHKIRLGPPDHKEMQLNSNQISLDF